MLMYGEACYAFSIDCIKFNITSLAEGFVRLNYLIPPNSLGVFHGRDFDIAYMNYIFENDVVFKDFFAIIYHLYIGNDVYLVVSKDDWSENLIESLLKLIQQRYGYNASEINSFEDYIYFKNNSMNGFDHMYGIANLDIDKERYTYLIESERLQKVGGEKEEVKYG